MTTKTKDARTKQNIWGYWKGDDGRGKLFKIGLSEFDAKEGLNTKETQMERGQGERV